jgi:hypothetical protein
MLFLEILIIAVALAFVFAKIQEKANSKPAAAAAAASTAAAPAPGQEVRRVLTIDGTTPFQGHIGFVKSFGIPPGEVSDLRYFSAANASLDALPDRVRDCLTRSYAGGFARGLEIPAMLEGGRTLAADEALYFALVQRPRMPAFVVAFVDKMRSK